MVVSIDEEVVAEQCPRQERLHHSVGFVEDRRRRRLGFRQRPHHVGVLGTLARIEEGHLRPRAAASEDATCLQQLPRRAVAGEGLPGLLCLLRQLVGRAEVNGDSLGSAQHVRRGCGGIRDAPVRGFGPQKRQALAELDLRSAADDGGVASGRRQRDGGRQCDLHFGHGELASTTIAPLGNVLLEHGMKVGPSEAKGTDTGSAGASLRRLPGSQFRVDPKWAVSEINVRVRFGEVEAGRQDFVVDRHRRLEDSSGSGT